jgi:dienelactone hydrolase
MRKGTKLNRRDFMESGTAGLAALGGIAYWAPALVTSASAQVAATSADSDSAIERRKQSLEVLLKILPATTSFELTGRINAIDKSWEEWVKRTGELPPDFDSMPSIAALPDPLLFRGALQSTPITAMEQWKRQREWIRSQFEHWIYGRMPPVPENLRAVVTGTHREGRVTVREVRLEFGPDHRAVLHVQLFIPDGSGPFPVFLTNHPRSSGWIYPAVRRGYIACIYQATDPRYGASDDSDKFIDVYPGYDFACLARWAWAAMRAVDYLSTLPEVDQHKIGITGHSRNGKQALLAAAFDERIGAVVASSGTTGECLPWRYTTDIFWGEGTLESMTGGPQNTHWFHPRLRFFVGREQKLPVDQNMLMAMVAPRGLIMYAAYSEPDANPFGYEQAYRSVLPVYRFLGHEENLWLHLRAGEHNFTPSEIENYINCLDAIFGRTAFPKSETWINGYTFEQWLNVTKEEIDLLRYPKRAVGDFVPESIASWDQQRSVVLKNILWALGEEPAGLPFLPVQELPASPAVFWIYSPNDNPLALLFGRPLIRPRMQSTILPFGDGLRGDLYYPVGIDGQPKPGRLPVVVWLHPYSYTTGYSRVSGRMPPFLGASFESLTRRGFAVLAFDQLGFGTRVLDARQFYEQYPKWSLMGKMIADTRAAIDAVSGLDMADPSRIYLVGYSMGAKVGLLTAALDKRVNAIAAVCGLDPLRQDTPEKGTEGVRHYSHLHGLMPRLGFFIGDESRLPFDYGQVLALIAPKPALIVAPTLDRYAPVEDVRREVEGARKIYGLLGHEGALELETPLDFNRFTQQTQERLFDWISQVR